MPIFVASTSRGLTETLISELKELGFDKTRLGPGGVEFETDWEGCYRANLMLRTSTRVILPVLEFPARNGEDLYANILKHDWTQYIDKDQTLAVEASVRDSEMHDQRYVALKSKDAIVDQFREKYGERPDVDKQQPDLVIVVRVIRNLAHVSVDTSGAGLFKRGYRVESVEAPIKEHVAAGLLRLAEWNPSIPLVDPMCGSGTFVIEAALQALNVPPGSLRKRFGFQNWKGFDEAAWDRVIDSALSQEKEELPFKFYGFDKDSGAIRAAKKNAAAAGVGEWTEFARREVAALTIPEGLPKGMIIVNPPYGERLTHEFEDSFRDLGFALKQNFKGWTAWVLSGNPDLPALMGMKSSRRIPIFNGPIECRWLKYEIR